MTKIIIMTVFFSLTTASGQIRLAPVESEPTNDRSYRPISGSGSKGSSSSSSRKFHSRCQSYNSCSLPVRLLRQGASNITSYIADKEGLGDDYHDPGLCSPVAATMLLQAFLDEAHLDTTPSSNLAINFSNTDHEGEKVWHMGKSMGTNFKKGGTVSGLPRFLDPTKQTFKNRLRFAFSKEAFFKSRGTMLHFADVENHELVQSIRNNKHGYLISVKSFQEKRKPGRNYLRPISGHSLAITGFNGDRLQISDPWGYNYYARIKRERARIRFAGTKNKKSFFESVGKNGWLSKLTTEGRKSALVSYIEYKIY